MNFALCDSPAYAQSTERMRTGRRVCLFYLQVCSLLHLVYGLLTLFESTKTFKTFITLHKGRYLRGSSVDCAYLCTLDRSKCIGFVRGSSYCYMIQTALSSSSPNETKADKSLATFYKIDRAPTVCPPSNWTYNSPFDNITSVYFVKNYKYECRNHNGRVVVITSTGELKYISTIQSELAVPLMLDARTNGTAWRWVYGREKITREYWRNETYPSAPRGWVGAITGDGGMTAIDTNRTSYRVLCECYDMTEF